MPTQLPGNRWKLPEPVLICKSERDAIPSERRHLGQGRNALRLGKMVFCTFPVFRNHKGSDALLCLPLCKAMSSSQVWEIRQKCVPGFVWGCWGRARRGHLPTRLPEAGSSSAPQAPVTHDNVWPALCVLCGLAGPSWGLHVLGM